MTIRNKVLENFGLKHWQTKYLKKYYLNGRVERLKVHFPELCDDINRIMETFRGEEITDSNINIDVRYVSSGIYISEKDYSYVHHHNIENIEDYITQTV